MPAARSAAASGDTRAVAPVTVIVGEEELLVERAVRAVVTEAATSLSALSADAGPAGSANVHDVRAADLSQGELTALAAPSLFGGGSVIVVRSAQDALKDVAAELTRHAGAPEPDVFLVITHSGGNKN